MDANHVNGNDQNGFFFVRIRNRLRDFGMLKLLHTNTGLKLNLPGGRAWHAVFTKSRVVEHDTGSSPNQERRVPLPPLLARAWAFCGGGGGGGGPAVARAFSTTTPP